MSFEKKWLLWHGCRILSECGIFDEHGHLSARMGEGSDTVMINVRSSPRTATLRDFTTFDLDAGEYPDAVPAEITIHSQILRQRDDVMAVCHNHSPYAISVASAGLEMRPVHPDGAIQAGPIPVFEDIHEAGGVLVTTEEEGAAIADTLGDNVAVMLRGHGAVVTGQSIADAILNSLKLEWNSRILYQQAQIGEPWYLPRDRVEREVERVHGDAVIEKTFDYYLTEGTGG